jgi:hypothetical protein
MALRGFGWRSIAACSKRGLSPVEGRERWLVVQVVARFGDCGAGTLVASLSAFVGAEVGAGAENDLAERVLRERWTRRRPSIVSDVCQSTEWNGSILHNHRFPKQNIRIHQSKRYNLVYNISIFSISPFLRFQSDHLQDQLPSNLDLNWTRYLEQCRGGYVVHQSGRAQFLRPVSGLIRA